MGRNECPEQIWYDRFLMVLRFWQKNHIPPTHRELMDVLDVGSTSVAKYHLEKFVKMGLITLMPFKARGIVLTSKGKKVWKKLIENQQNR